MTNSPYAPHVCVHERLSTVTAYWCRFGIRLSRLIANLFGTISKIKNKMNDLRCINCCVVVRNCELSFTRRNSQNQSSFFSLAWFASLKRVRHESLGSIEETGEATGSGTGREIVGTAAITAWFQCGYGHGATVESRMDFVASMQ